MEKEPLVKYVFEYGLVILLVMAISGFCYRAGKSVVQTEAERHGFLTYDQKGCVVWKSEVKSRQISDGGILPSSKYKAYVSSVYDGDTITVDFRLGMGVQLNDQKIRLIGIDTPELRGEEREQGIISRDYLRSIILQKWIVIEVPKDKKGKYGRWLGILYADADGDGVIENLNNLLVENGYAVEAEY